MADKRTTPDPAEGGRRKRPAPTIDLTATEVPASAAADEPHVASGEKAAPPPEPNPAQDQPEATHKSERADEHNGSSRKKGAPWQVLLAGFAAAATKNAPLFCFLCAGLVPVPYT